jgi:uncharacterized protein involved in exopolysaccharide biosynthesis
MAVLVGTAMFLSRQPVVYSSYTTIKIEERKTVAGLLTEWVLYSPADVMESATKLIKGYEVMKQSAVRLGFINENSPVDKVTDAVAQMQGSITTERISTTNMIRISSSADTPKTAMDMANTVAEVYIEENLREKAQQVRHTRQFIEEQLASLEERLRTAEENMRGFAEKSKRVRLAEPIEKKLTDLQFELAAAQQKYTESHPTVK